MINETLLVGQEKLSLPLVMRRKASDAAIQQSEKEKEMYMHRVFWERKWLGLDKICGITLLLLLFHIQPVAASVTVSSLKIEQGDYLGATIPQFESGMEPRLLSKFNETYRNVVLQAFGKFETVALRMRADSQIPDHMKNSMTFRAGYEMFRNDDRFVSVTQKTYQYTGGAHGMSWMSASTIDLQTGSEYELVDLFVSGADYASRLNEVVRREGRIRKLPLWGFKGVGADSGFYLTNDGVVLFFQLYEIAPYSEGFVKMLIPYQEIADILRAEVGK